MQGTSAEEARRGGGQRSYRRLPATMGEELPEEEMEDDAKGDEAEEVLEGKDVGYGRCSCWEELPALTFVFQHPSVTLFLAVFSTGIGGTFQYGYNISIINAPTMYVQKFINETWEVRYSSGLDRDLLRLLWSIIVSTFTLGGFLGAWLGGPLAVRFGRKGTLLLINVIVLAGSALMGASNPAGTFELLIVGRLLVGLHSGVTLCVQPMYLGEIAPKALRGTISMGSSITLTAGIFIGQVMGQRRFHNADTYWSELEGLERERAETQLQQSKQLCQLLTDRSTRWQLVTIIILNAAQQCSGINAIYFYATYVFNQAGIAEAYIPYVTLGTGASECLSALCCVSRKDSSKPIKHQWLFQKPMRWFPWFDSPAIGK
ncbi:hypothetical protein scyTo_0007299 [Scyliorhinus torazame]|uniref:Major facilitator superfamily (MFS) profile domain-containing protein n=1 Tax=Scyliorhinus torazame TaxID=75743 RepID=A0A401NPS6_SCYTO|nr:hypothetical protein [Scyliorhinus torazame]